MGIHNIWPLLSATGHTSSLDTLTTKRVAIDTSIWLHQYSHVTGGGDNLASQLLFGLFLRTLKMKYYGIKPVFIFDGKTPAIKKRCVERRRKKWDDEKRMKGVLKKLVMKEQVRAKVHDRIFGGEEAPAQRSRDEIEQERRERSGELTFNVADANTGGVQDSEQHDDANGLDDDDDSWLQALDVPDVDMPPSPPRESAAASRHSTTTTTTTPARHSHLSASTIPARPSPLTTTSGSNKKRMVVLDLNDDSVPPRPAARDDSDDDTIQVVSHTRPSTTTTTTTSSRTRTPSGIIHEFDQDIDFSLLDADELPRDAPILLQNADIDISTFHQLPPNIQREVIADLKRKAEFKYYGGTIERTKAQGGGIDTFSGNQMDALIKSNSAHHSLKRIQELQQERQEIESLSPRNTIINRNDSDRDSLPTLESSLSQSVWSGTNTQGETMEIVQTTPRSAETRSPHGDEAQSLVVDDIEDEEGMGGGFLPESDEDVDESAVNENAYNTGGFLPESDEEGVEQSEAHREPAGFLPDDEDEWENDVPPEQDTNQPTHANSGGFMAEDEDDEWEEVSASTNAAQSTTAAPKPKVTFATPTQAPTILTAPSNDTLQALGLDPEVFANLPFSMQQEILRNLGDVPDVSPIVKSSTTSNSAPPPAVHDLTDGMQDVDEEWEDVAPAPADDARPHTAINIHTLSELEKAFARELFPSEIFDRQADLAAFSKTMNQAETDFEAGVAPIDPRIKDPPKPFAFNPDQEEDPELRRLSVQSLLSNATTTPRNKSFDEENRVLQDMYAKENPDYTPGKDTSVTLSSPSLQNTPDIYDVATPNTLFNSPDYQRKIRLQTTSRREGSLAVYNEYRELINQLFRLLGVPYIQSPYEADAQCGFLAQKHMIDAIISDDSDIFVFGGYRLFKFAFKKSDDKVVEEYNMDRIQKDLGLSRYDLIAMAMLLGSDYTEGVHNVGPVTAIEVIEAFRPSPKKAAQMDPEDYIFTILKEFSKWANLLTTKKPTKVKTRKDRFMRKYHNLKKRAVFPSGFPDRTVIRAYLEPQVDTNEDPIIWGDTEAGEELYDYCQTYMGLDRESVDKYLEPVKKKQRERQTQLTLDSFPTVEAKKVAKIRSERVKYAVSRLKRMKKNEVKELDKEEDVMAEGSLVTNTESAERKQRRTQDHVEEAGKVETSKVKIARRKSITPKQSQSRKRKRKPTAEDRVRAVLGLEGDLAIADQKNEHNSPQKPPTRRKVKRAKHNDDNVE